MVFDHDVWKRYEFVWFLSTMVKNLMNSYGFWGCSIFSSYRMITQMATQRHQVVNDNGWGMARNKKATEATSWT